MTRRRLLSAGSAVALHLITRPATAAKSRRFTFSKIPLMLGADSVSDSIHTLHLGDIADLQPKCAWRLRDATPLTDRLFRLALHSFEENVYTADPLGTYLTAGTHWGARKYTRDVSYSGLLGANVLFPELMLSSLKNFTATREELGWRVPTGWDARSPELKVDWIVEPIPILEYLAKYRTDPYTHRTDDVVWIWAMHDLFQRNPGLADWEWFYRAGMKQFSSTYDLFFDVADGLYRGQLTFVDVTGSGYAPHSSVADCVLVKATATNCLYVMALRAMAEAAERTGHADEAKNWRKRAEVLRTAIVEHLRLPGGGFSCYRDRAGLLRPERDAMGTALVILAGVVRGKEARRAIDGYPRDERGVPLFEPFLPWGSATGQYHNHSAWPFASTFFYKALEVAERRDCTDENAAMLARFVTAEKAGAPATFREYCWWQDGVPRGSADQLWSAAAFLDVCWRAGLIVGVAG
ncbi:MAG: hypothetical protein V4555_10050 [Acidobacteriota bacterium]